MRKKKLSAKEQAFCLQHRIKAESFKSKAALKNLTDEDISLIGNIYRAYAEVCAAERDTLHFYTGFYKKFVLKYQVEPIQIQHHVSEINFQAPLVDILKEMGNLLDYFNHAILETMKAHMKSLTEREFLDWLEKIISFCPANRNVLLLQVKNCEPCANFSTKMFAEGISNLKAHPNKEICSMSMSMSDEKSGDTIKLAFIPSLFSEREIKNTISGFLGTPETTLVTWI